jgi:hypothetical protein
VSCSSVSVKELSARTSSAPLSKRSVGVRGASFIHTNPFASTTCNQRLSQRLSGQIRSSQVRSLFLLLTFSPVAFHRFEFPFWFSRPNLLVLIDHTFCPKLLRIVQYPFRNLLPRAFLIVKYSICFQLQISTLPIVPVLGRGRGFGFLSASVCRFFEPSVHFRKLFRRSHRGRSNRSRKSKTRKTENKPGGKQRIQEGKALKDRPIAVAHVERICEDVRLVAAACCVELEAVVWTLDALALLYGAHKRAHR